MNDRINLYSGGSIDLLNPDLNDINLLDIAYGLSHTARFVGQTTRFYSVAEHSLNVSYWAGRLAYEHRAPQYGVLRERQEQTLLMWEAKLFGLLHDASEAYLGDVSGPLKKHLPGYKKIEGYMMSCIMNRFRVDDPTGIQYNLVDEADKRFLMNERMALLCTNDPLLWKPYEHPKGPMVEAENVVALITNYGTPQETREAFVAEFNTAKDQIAQIKEEMNND